MTSKEFLRRKLFYFQLDRCALFFLKNDSLNYVFRATLYEGPTSSIVTDYCVVPDLDLFDTTLLYSCEYVSFDKFTRQEFITQLRYFLAFINRLSAIQLKSLKSSHSCDNLFAFALKYEDTK